MTYHVAAVDDDPDILSVVKRILSSEGYRVTVACSEAQLWSRVELDAVDLFILDLVLPEGSGLNIARCIRKSSNVGIIFLTGLADEVDTVLALETGGDDYITKPFRARELRARVKSVLRRSGKSVAPAEEEAVRRIGDWVVDLARRVVIAPNGKAVDLTSSEFDTLVVLSNVRGRVLSRDQIVEMIRGDAWSANARLVDGIVSRLRKKLVSAGDEDPVRTVRGAGYAIREDLSDGRRQGQAL